jgi:NADPH:quinone reductase-like Zn-dependent oxidoreductase
VPFPLPFVPLSDGAGVVAAVGELVKNLVAGDKVFTVFKPMWRSGRLRQEFEESNLATPGVPGVLSEYVVLDQEYWAPMPSNLTFVEASTLTVAGVTAWNALYGLSDYQLRPGQCVLTEGTGGVSIFSLQVKSTSDPTQLSYADGILFLVCESWRSEGHRHYVLHEKGRDTVGARG